MGNGTERTRDRVLRNFAKYVRDGRYSWQPRFEKLHMSLREIEKLMNRQYELQNASGEKAEQMEFGVFNGSIILDFCDRPSGKTFDDVMDWVHRNNVSRERATELLRRLEDEGFIRVGPRGIDSRNIIHFTQKFRKRQQLLAAEMEMNAESIRENSMLLARAVLTQMHHVHIPLSIGLTQLNGWY